MHEGCAISKVEFVPEGELEVQLHCSALEFPPKCIEDSDVDLGAVECSITGAHLQHRV